MPTFFLKPFRVNQKHILKIKEDFTMGLRIQNNIAAMNAHRQLTISDAGLSKSLERLSSGYRINRAADDAAGLAISQGMRADIASYKVASRNVSEANAMLQVAEGAYDQIGNMLVRLKELATQAASANAGNDLLKIDAEADELKLEIDRIADSTEYAGSKIINGTDVTSATFQVGNSADSSSQITADFTDVNVAELGITDLGLDSVASAQAALTLVDTAIGTLNTSRGTLGAMQNRLGYAAANLSTTIENVQAAESVIRDVDMASEMTTFTKNQILLQAGTAMLAQANMAPQVVLSLFG
jgi:flagellin